ncbi:hypothetical protein [Arthrobacter sp. AD-310]
METLKKIVTNQYFPAAAVLTAVVLFWAVGLLGGLSLLHNNQPPLTTLTWMLFVYGAAVLTPLAGLLAAADLLRRWRLNRAAAAAPETDDAGTRQAAAVQPRPAEAAVDAGVAEPRREPAVEQPAMKQATNKPVTNKPSAKKPATKKSGAKKAA